MSNVNRLAVVSFSFTVLFNCSSITTAFLVIHRLTEQNVTDKSVPASSPPNFTAAAGFVFDAICSSDHPVDWSRRSHPFAKELNKSSIVTKSGYDLILHIEAVTDKDVGFYHCNGTESLGKKETGSFYLFVDDPANLRVGPRLQRIKHTTYEPAEVPCIPTAPDVDVKLLTSFREPIPFSTNPKDEKTYIYYDPRRGFIVPGVHLEGTLHTYICKFTKRSVEQEMIIELFVNTDLKPNMPVLEYQAVTKNKITAEPGSTVQFVAEVYANANFKPDVRWCNSTWHTIVTGSKYSVEMTPGELEEYTTRLIIHNVDKGDTGRYSVWINNTRQLHPHRLYFFLHIGVTDKLDIVMDKVFLISEKIFIADCTVSSPKKRLSSIWTIRPYGCEGNHSCEKEVTPLDKMKPGDIGYVMRSPHSIALHRPVLGNLTCSVVFNDNTTASVTRPLILSEVKEGFQVEFKSHFHNVILNCNVSRYLYSDNLYWIDAKGSVVTENTTHWARNFTLTKSETKYSYQLSLKINTDWSADLNGEEYRCMAVDYHHVPQFKSLKIQIVSGYAPAIFGSSMNNGTWFAEDGSYVNLTCYTSGYPDPAIYWYKDDVKTGEDGQNELAFVVDMNASARYSCRIRNHFGSDFVYSDLVIYQPVKSFKDTERKNGWNLQEMLWPRIALLCSDGGQPVHDVTWFKDEKRVLESSRIAVKMNGSILIIDPLEMKDLGFYSCRSDWNPQFVFCADSSTGNVFPVAWTVLGSIIGIILLPAMIYLGVRRYRSLRTCKTAFTYRSLLHRE